MTKYTVRVPEQFFDFEVGDDERHNPDRLWYLADSRVFDGYDLEVYGPDGQQIDLDPNGEHSANSEPESSDVEFSDAETRGPGTNPGEVYDGSHNLG